MAKDNDRLDRIERDLAALVAENRKRPQEERKRAEERAQEDAKRAQEERKRAEERAQEDAKRAQERAQEDAKRAAEWERGMRELRAQIGGLGNGLGRLSEGLMAPNLARLLRQVNIRYKGCDHYPGIDRKRNGRTMQIDLLAVGQWRGGGPVVVAVEVSTYLTVPEVEQALRKFGEFLRFFDEYQSYELVGGVAGIRLVDQAVARAQKEGLLVIAPSGETARLLLPPKFRPRIWRAGRDGG